MPSEKELRFVKHLSRRLQRKLNNATSTTKLIITIVGILMPRGLNHEYILSFMLFLFLVIVLIVGLQTFHHMPYQISCLDYFYVRTEDEIDTPDIGALVAVKWL